MTTRLATPVTAELLKLRTVRTGWTLAGTMTGLAALAVALHGITLPTQDLDTGAEQLRVVAFGVSLGCVFAALLGALSITTEHRHGTIRPTLLGTPNRTQLLLSKAVIAALASLGLGIIAAGVALAALHATLGNRDIAIRLTQGDDTQLIAGAAVSAAVWALIGLGVGTLVRNQVPAITGIFMWVFILENLLIDSAPDFSRYLPGSLAQGLAGNSVGTLDNPAVAVAVLALYAVTAVLLGNLRLNRTDVA